MSTNNYKERILELMHAKGLSKSELGNAMGVQKQNVNALLETNNVDKIISIARILDVTLNDIVGSEINESDVKGCVVYGGVVHVINSKQDIEDILSDINRLANLPAHSTN